MLDMLKKKIKPRSILGLIIWTSHDYILSSLLVYSALTSGLGEQLN
jgi:hypothetical protein